MKFNFTVNAAVNTLAIFHEKVTFATDVVHSKTRLGSNTNRRKRNEIKVAKIKQKQKKGARTHFNREANPPRGKFITGIVKNKVGELKKTEFKVQMNNSYPSRPSVNNQPTDT